MLFQGDKFTEVTREDQTHHHIMKKNDDRVAINYAAYLQQYAKVEVSLIFFTKF